VVAATGFAILKSTNIIQVYHITSITVLSLLTLLSQFHQTILLAKQKIIQSNLIQIVWLLLQASGIGFAFMFCALTMLLLISMLRWWRILSLHLLSFYLIRDIVKFSEFRKHFTWGELKISFRYGFLYQSVEVLQLLNLRYYFFQLGLQEGSQYLGITLSALQYWQAVWLIPRSISTVQYISTSNAEKIKEEAERTIQ